MMPVKPRTSRTVTNGAISNLASELNGYPGVTVKLDRDAGTIEARTDDGTLFLCGMQKGADGAWIATASTDYIELG